MPNKKHQENDEDEFVTREFTIGQGGISLLPRPFQSYYGLLSRAPTRLSPDLPRGEESGARAEAT